MKLLIPSTGTPISFFDILAGVTSSFNRPMAAFEATLKAYTNKKHCSFTNSGTTAFYLILKALKNLSNKTEVVLPAYTAPSLILPIRKAGLKPVLCDISLKTFNMDIPSLGSCVNENTLCIVPVHMFGAPMDMEAVMAIARQRAVFVVEDAASSLGTLINNRPTGIFGDVGFYSFNRGKNLSTLSGGCIITDNAGLAEKIRSECASLPKPKLVPSLKASVKLVALSLAVRPLFYTLFYNLISKLKYIALHTDFESFAYTNFQAGVGRSLFSHTGRIFGKRHDYGMFLFDKLKGLKGISLPELIPHATTVFNQFPILFNDEGVKEKVFERIINTGIESTKLYPDPIHRVYDLGYDVDRKDPFPNATYFSKRLLLIPTHPMLNVAGMSRIVNIIKEGLGS
ncbi:MAG: DegT/DnrJ/EryC1/StrS family aminotransferase [Planctomycetes bacterium]|nr:DegT/DnrJ/EryC1/StrS family aminotransferase [Planctomycetota bacterium]